MQTQFDEERWPDLTQFRRACLEEAYDVMEEIAERKHRWYKRENPDDLPMQRLAKIYQAQYFSGSNRLDDLKSLVAKEPWVVNATWTAQKWLPITQAAGAHGDWALIEFLLDSGADPTAVVGDPGDRASVVEMARYGKNEDLAVWLESLIAESHKSEQDSGGNG